MVADKSIKELENSQVALTITVDAETIEKAYAKRLAKYASSLQIDGFRKGKVPTSVVERKYGSSIREESTFDCMEENLKEAIETLEEDKKPLAFSTPALQDEEKLIPFQKDSAVTFTVVYDVYPKFDLPEYKGLEVKVPQVEITDEDVNKEIDILRDQNAMVIRKDGKAEKGNIVTIDYAEIDQDGKTVEGTDRKDFTFTIGSGYNFYKLDDDVIGMAKDEEKDVEKTYTEEDNVPGYAGKTVRLHIAVKEIKVREIPALDDDFAQDVKEEYKTVQDLVDATKAKLEKNLDEKMKGDKIEALMADILSKTEIAVPASMVDMELEQSWKRFVQQSGLEEDQLMKFFKMQNQTKEAIIEQWREPAVKNIKEQIILEAVKKKEDFELDQAELEKAYEEQLKNIQDEGAKDYYKNMIKDDMQFAKVVPFLLENNKFVPGDKVSYKDYMSQGIQE